MSKLDKSISAIVLGLIAPVTLFLLFWWGSIPFIDDGRVVMILALGGLAVGIVLDFTVLRQFTLRLFELPMSVLFVLAVFYSILIYGFFMGFPVFNALVGIACAYIMGRKCILHGADRQAVQKNARKVNLFSFILLLFICVCTALLALRETTIESQVQGMLSLPFEVTREMIWVIILAGGALLLGFQYTLSRLVFRRFERKAA